MANRSRSRGQISELTHLAPIKQGFATDAPRRLRYADRLRIVLESFNTREDQGAPGVIRVFRGLHTAKWALLDGDTKLLLSVVFDGDLHGYLRALARDIPATLGLVWSNCEGWEDPANDPQKLIAFIERHQLHANFFYAQYPQLTVPDVEELLQLKAAYAKRSSDSEVARELHRGMQPLSTAERTKQLLDDYPQREELKQSFTALLQPMYDASLVERASHEEFSGTRPQSSSEQSGTRADGVQALLAHGLPAAHAARMLFLNLPETGDARAWLRGLRDRLTFGRNVGEGPYLSLGFTYDGLVKLGVNQALLSELPEAFVLGMGARAAALGDVALVGDPSARSSWTVESPQGRGKPVHVVLFVHVNVPENSELGSKLKAVGMAAQTYARGGAATTAGDEAYQAGKLREALGQLLDDTQASLHLPGGALILGHQDLHQPLVAHDQTAPYAVEYFGFRDGVSQPSLPGDKTDEQHASFDPVLRSDKRGLLKDASFLAVRQLRQKPEAFWEAMAKQASALQITARELAERIVGRRIDGRRLDRKGDGPFDPVLDRHAFDAGAAESSCPFHSHVRRVNPRLEPDRQRNPRLLRRGMAYLNARPEGGTARGLMFLAFNADLEGQFELMQRNWLQGGNQVGLGSHDRDVLTGTAQPTGPFQSNSAARFYTESERTAHELHFEQTFVELEWGIYLYIPAREALGWL